MKQRLKEQYKDAMTQSWFFYMANKINKHLTYLAKKQMQISILRNKSNLS